jgi:hypothetical protein
LFSAFIAWPQPSPPTSNSLPPHPRQHGFDRADGRHVAADHDGERAVCGAWHASRDRRIDQGNSAPPQLCAECAGAHRVSRTHIDDDAAGAEAASKRPAVRLQQRVTHLAAARQHGDDQIGAFAERLQRRRRLRAMGLGKALCPLRRDVVGRHREASAGKIGGHRRAHVAQADETDALDLAHRRCSVMTGPSPSKTGANALLSRPSTPL